MTTRQIIIKEVELTVEENEFVAYTHPVFNNLKFLHGLGELERMIGLIKDISFEQNIDNIACINSTHGGFIPLFLKEDKQYKVVEDVIENIPKYSNESPYIVVIEIKNIMEANIINEYVKKSNDSVFMFISFDYKVLYCLNQENSIIVNGIGNPVKPRIGCILKSNKYVKGWVATSWMKYFAKNDKEINYDNLVNYCLMVCNGGEQMMDTLEHNKKLMDKCTIMDTYSTDDTVETIKKFTKNKFGVDFFQKKFVNFKVSRNVVLKSAYNRKGSTCFCTLFLDDTYRISNPERLREFLDLVRDDIFVNSYSFYIDSDDVQYTTNRIINLQFTK